MYLGGRGVPADQVSGLMWLEIARARGNPWLADAVDDIAAHLTEAEREAAWQRARACLASGYRDCG